MCSWAPYALTTTEQLICGSDPRREVNSIVVTRSNLLLQLFTEDVLKGTRDQCNGIGTLLVLQ